MTDQPLTLGGRYRLGPILGRGGMAEVHVADDLRLGRQVAVKMLRADLARDPTFQARFRREAQSAASLNHPAVVAVYDTGEDALGGASVPYIVMEYVEGSTLRDLLRSGHRLLPERALEITAGLLEALDYSHRRGIVHRDIKPANVMLTGTGEVKVMDFGIARAVADTAATMTQTAAVIGTAQYLSPEQARGEQVDARSDLYSTGCLLYELLTGRPPFVGDSPVAVAYQHVREEPAPPSSLDPDISPEVDAIVLKALAKDREQRYQTAAEMRADIERALAGRPVQAATAVLAGGVTQPLPTLPQPAPVAAPAPTVAPEPPPERRRTWAYVLLALAVLAVFVLAALLGRDLVGGGQRVTVPSVEGLTVSQARAALERERLVVGAQRQQVTEDVEPGRVVAQSPPARTSVDEGSAVDLTVAVAPQRTRVPTVVGLSEDDARRALEAAGLAVGRVTTEDSADTRGTIRRVTPGEQTEVAAGTQVTLVVASGENRVPDVTGDSEAQARAQLQQAGFRVRVERRQTNAGSPGEVIDQNPEAGATRRVDSEVRIVVAEQPPQQPTPTPTPSATSPSPTQSPTQSPTRRSTGSPSPAAAATGSPSPTAAATTTTP